MSQLARAKRYLYLLLMAIPSDDLWAEDAVLLEELQGNRDVRELALRPPKN